MYLVKDKISLITGASRGIGRAIALKLAENGSHIAFTYLSSEQKAKNLEEEIKKLGVKVKAYKCDASNFDDCTQLIDSIIKDFERIDVLVNNAGITRDNLLLRMSEEDWDKVITTNLKSTFSTVKAASKYFMKQRSGSIVNISSIIGIKGNGGQANYAASKAGVIGFSKSVAIELGPRGIRCNVIAPGWIETDMTNALPDKYKDEIIKYIPLRRVGKPKEIAECALFLASNLSQYITGQVIKVDGGILT
ncbi:MAG: 3-oxoacyl-[acyl-carrier-protein] reductase [Bacteroidetes bacterium]|nr:3-oxoacyl-[acyl-carrier-protein] reductase [Bacteroidota bacterium]